MAAVASPPNLLTYEAYMAEDEINLRYAILDGKRIFMPPVSDAHQMTVMNIAVPIKKFADATKRGKGRIGPRDMLITRVPLRTRQPDVYFISSERNALNPAPNDPAPLEFAPELVVEIISDSETDARFEAKIADYCAAGVEECWKVLRITQTVEVLRLSAAGPKSAGIYGRGESIQSLTFPDLSVPVDAIFEFAG